MSDLIKVLKTKPDRTPHNNYFIKSVIKGISLKLKRSILDFIKTPYIYDYYYYIPQ